ncbi:hypothetical protein [Nocardia vermiculata]|uniref:hypothetical protein n=1 Tax=Nocardia vermiculata TaxID=257274 RepID=UPI00082A202C|nr:hypothetical protein [Nocardia vermiculata]
MMRNTTIRRVLAAGAFAASAAIAAAPLAHADADPSKFSERTADFVNYTDPVAYTGQAAASGKQVVLSPYGVAPGHTIACRGNGTTVPLYDCMQQDDLGWITLQKYEIPVVGTTWVYMP